jgi:hypothetical protein
MVRFTFLSDTLMATGKKIQKGAYEEVRRL